MTWPGLGLYQKSLDLQEEGVETEFVGFKAAHFKFLQHVIDVAADSEAVPDYHEKLRRPNAVEQGIEQLGQVTTRGFESFGFISRSIVDGMKRPTKLVIGETIRQIHETGVKAIPIVMVVCFLMGIVLAYQSAGQ